MTRRIGLVGFFGWGNYGDELFHRVWQEYLGPHAELKVVHDLLQRPYFSRPVEKVLKKVDAILIGGGDLVIPWTVSELYWREEYLTRPVHIAGVGVPTWRSAVPAVIERMRRFMQHPNVRSISARDPESAQWISRHLEPKVEVTWAPDLVFAMDLPAVAPDPSRKTVSIVTRFRRSGDDDLTQLHRLARKALDMGWRTQSVVLATGRTGKVDLDVARQFEALGVETVHSEDLDVLTRALGESTVVITMKFHGTVVATSYGVPAFPVAATDKSRNLFKIVDRLPMLCGLKDPTLPDRLDADLVRVPDDVRDRLRTMSTDGVKAVRDAIMRG